MFDSIVVRGTSATILWGYRTAVTLTSWSIQKHGAKKWVLTAKVASVDAFQVRQRPLLFTAPRDKGRWCWDVQELHLSERSLTATLGQPLQ